MRSKKDSRKRLHSYMIFFGIALSIGVLNIYGVRAYSALIFVAVSLDI